MNNVSFFRTDRFHMGFRVTVGMLGLLLWPAKVFAAKSSSDAPTASTLSVATRSPDTLKAYQSWKSRFLRQGSCQADERYVDSSGDAGSPGDITVSEAHGYGMLALVAMGDADSEAHADFDRMVNLLVRHNVKSGLPLMVWRLTAECASGKLPSTGKLETSAPDGDLDIAYALLAAETRWGNRGNHDYGQLARARINALMDHVVQRAETSRPFMGLWEDVGAGDRVEGGTRVSDYMMGHFAAFYAATGDVRWQRLIDHGYTIMATLQADNKTGLLPEFAIVRGESIQKAPKKYLEGMRDDAFAYNSCRLPWRLAHAAKQYDDARAREVLGKLNDTLLALSDGKPHQLLDGYELKGAPIGSQRDRLAFLGPIAAGLAALPQHAEAAKVWQAAVSDISYDAQSYYNETLRLLTLLYP